MYQRVWNVLYKYSSFALSVIKWKKTTKKLTSHDWQFHKLRYDKNETMKQREASTLTSQDPLIISPISAGVRLTATADNAVSPTLPAKYM